MYNYRYQFITTSDKEITQKCFLIKNIFYNVYVKVFYIMICMMLFGIGVHVLLTQGGLP